MASKERRARHKQLVRQEILDAARDILVRDGYARLTMRRVAERIEYSPTAIYLHFKGREELVFSVCEETFARLVRDLEAAGQRHKDPLLRLKAGLRCYVDFGLSHPQHYLATFVVPRDRDSPETAARYQNPETSGMRALGILRAAIEACVRERKLRRVDVEAATLALWAAVHGITSLMIAYQHFAWGDRDKLIDLLIDGAVDGLRPGR